MPPGPTLYGRYAVHQEIACGGMASVHLGRVQGAIGFTRVVAIKRLLPQFSKDPDFVAMFLDEARLAARIRHPNVVPTLDVIAVSGELLLVMEYIHGLSLSRLLKAASAKRAEVPVAVACSIVVGALHGLHAAHGARSENGELLGIVHRDISPQNIMVGADGLARVLDFGVAKAAWRVQTTRDGQVKGKLSYMAPEQATGGEVGPWTDAYSAAVVLWEALTLQKLFHRGDEDGILGRFTGTRRIEPPSQFNPAVPPELDALVLKGLESEPGRRFQTAEALAEAIESVVAIASNTQVSRWLSEVATEDLRERSLQVALVENELATQASIEAASLPRDEATAPTLPADKLGHPARLDVAGVSPSASTAEDPSRISMARTQDPFRASKRRGPLVAAASVFVVAATGLIAIFGASQGPPSALTSAAGTPDQSPLTSTAPATAAPASSSVAAPASSLVGITSAASTIEAAPSASSPARAAEPPSTARRPRPRVNCNPPYTIDARGVRRLKPACVK